MRKCTHSQSRSHQAAALFLFRRARRGRAAPWRRGPAPGKHRTCGRSGSPGAARCRRRDRWAPAGRRSDCSSGRPPGSAFHRLCKSAYWFLLCLSSAGNRRLDSSILSHIPPFFNGLKPKNTGKSVVFRKNFLKLGNEEESALLRACVIAGGAIRKSRAVSATKPKTSFCKSEKEVFL